MLFNVHTITDTVHGDTAIISIKVSSVEQEWEWFYSLDYIKKVYKMNDVINQIIT